MDLIPLDIYQLNFNAAVVLCLGFCVFPGALGRIRRKQIPI